MYEDCRYKIGDFAAMVGMPQSKVRFYEKMGLFSSQREENGYRYFTPNDAFRANAFRVLLQYGFNVEQAIAMLDAKQGDGEFEASLQSQRDRLVHEQDVLRYRLARLNSALDMLNPEQGAGFSLIDVDDQIYARASYGKDFSVSKTNEYEIAAFYDLLSVSNCARIISRSDIEGISELLDPSYIVCMPEHEAYRLDDKCDEDHLGHLTMGKCLRFQRRMTREESLRRDSFGEMFLYLEAHGYHLRSDILLLPTFLNMDGKGSDIETLLVPIG